MGLFADENRYLQLTVLKIRIKYWNLR